MALETRQQAYQRGVNAALAQERKKTLAILEYIQSADDIEAELDAQIKQLQAALGQANQSDDPEAQADALIARVTADRAGGKDLGDLVADALGCPPAEA